MEKNKVLESYINNFNSPIGAYVYMLLNQNTPELFTLSSNRNNDLSIQLENILLNANDLDSLTKQINSIPKEHFEIVNEQSPENDLSKSTILKLIDNIKYVQTNWNSPNAWNELDGFIEYNKYSEFIADKSSLQKRLQEYVEKFSLASFSLNPNFSPNEFLEKFEHGINSMCEVLNIQPKQIGLNVLHLNYKTEEGDFTGYVTNDDLNTPGNNFSFNKMVINKPEVFAHEWIHFVESSLGFRGYSFTDLMDNIDLEKLNRLFPRHNEILKFKTTITTNEESYSEQTLLSSVKSASHFLERYALDSNNFYSQIEKISQEFETNYKEGKDRKESIELFEKSISELLQQPHPTRYFSFLKAQCELYIDKIEGKSLEKNQLLDFAKKSDEYLKLSDYTQSTLEVFARTFESYLYDKLKSCNKECSVVSSSYDSDFYPQSKMKTKLNELWDKMWIQLKADIDIIVPRKPTNSKEFMHNNISELRKKFNQDNSEQSKLKIG